jgi:hypothetical protein
LTCSALALALGGCAAEDDEIDIEFRPGSPQCNGCTIKTAEYTIADPDPGDAYDGAIMYATVSYAGTCPLKPRPDPCEHSGVRNVDDDPREYTDEDLPMATGANGTYDVVIEVDVVHADGSESILVIDDVEINL